MLKNLAALEEKSTPKQWWTADELEVLLAYVQQQDPNEKTNYAEVVDLLTAEGYQRTEKQVQKKFERMRWESKAKNIDLETRLQDLIAGMKYDDDDEEPVQKQTTSKPATPKPTSKSESQRKRWTLQEHQVLLECLLSGNDDVDDMQEKLPNKDRDRIKQKIHNCKNTAREKNISIVELVQLQINRLKGIADEDNMNEEESSEEEEKTPAKRGTKRKAEDNHSEERSAKKQRVIESPRLNGPKANSDDFGDGSDVKLLLGQMSNNNRINFVNLRTYIRDKFEEQRIQYEELKVQVTNLEDKMDLILKEIRSVARTSNGTTPSKSQIPQAVNTTNKDHNASNKSHTSSDPSPSKQISYYKFL